MLALQFRRSVSLYLVARLLGRRFPWLVTGPASSVRLRDVPEPALPGPEWVRVRPLLSGICGSDVAVLAAEGTPYLSPLVSFPFVPGHELVGEVTEVGPGVESSAVGQRVVVEPALGCRVRGIAPPCEPCCAGYHGCCERVLEGDISAGLQTGFCRDTGGGWGPSLVAHQSQLYPVPEGLPNDAAVLAEPLSCAIHGVLRARLEPERRVLVLGCGTIGLLTIAALRAFAPSCTVVAVAKYRHQQRFAQELGAAQVIPSGPAGYRRLQEITGATLLKLPWGKPHVLGGVEASFVCIASAGAWEDALRWTRAHGSVVMVGMPGDPRVDMTPFWQKELRLMGAYAYGLEEQGPGVAATFRLSLEMLSCQGWGERLAPLVSHRFPLRGYRQAFATAMKPGKYGAVKTVFDLSSSA